MKRIIFVCYVFIFSTLSLFAQKISPVLAVLPFYAPAELQNEGLQIEKLVQSYITDMDLFRLIATEDRNRVLSEWEFSVNDSLTDVSATQKLGTLLSADYLLQGTLGKLGSSYLLTLEVIKVKSGEKVSFTSIEPSVDLLSANLKKILAKTFIQQSDNSKDVNRGSQKSSITENDIIGTWRGDKGIEIIRLYPGGHGQAIFTSGARMELTYTIDAGVLLVSQNSPNTERYYHPLPYRVAHQLVSLAQPMKWMFTSLVNNTILRGKKLSTAVRYNGEQLIEVIHGTEREAEWIRIGN